MKVKLLCIALFSIVACTHKNVNENTSSEVLTTHVITNNTLKENEFEKALKR